MNSIKTHCVHPLTPLFANFLKKISIFYWSCFPYFVLFPLATFFSSLVCLLACLFRRLCWMCALILPNWLPLIQLIYLLKGIANREGPRKEFHKRINKNSWAHRYALILKRQPNRCRGCLSWMFDHLFEIQSLRMAFCCDEVKPRNDF